MDDLLRLITLQDANTRVVLLGAALLGLAAGVIGSFAVLRRRALVGDALAHCSLPGVCLAYFVVGDRSFPAFLLGALIFGVLGVGAIAWIRAYTRVKEDAAIGLVLSVFFGLGVVLLSVIQHMPSGNRAGLETFIMGKAAGMVRQDVRMIGWAAGLVVLTVVVLFKEFKLLCFDPGFAGSLGRPVAPLDLLLMTLIAVCTVIGLPAVGVVLMAALLIIPAAAARFWTEKLWVMVVLAGAFGMTSGLVGVSISALRERLPAGPLVALSATALFLVSMLAAPRRGIIAEAARRISLRRRVGIQNLLRAAYELDEAAVRAGRRHSAHSLSELSLKRGWRPAELRRLIRRAARAGFLRAEPGASPLDERLVLTEPGAAEARHLVRAHRLWELFLIEQADIAPDHVDRDADRIEHFIPRDVLERLERKLRDQGRLPEPGPHLPSSPHAIGPLGAGAHE